jgi:putative ABC transport system substrate-binding protein
MLRVFTRPRPIPEVELPISLRRTTFSLKDVVGCSPRFEGTMRRREFIALVGSAACAWPLAARAQQRERMRRIGVLVGGLAADDPIWQARSNAFIQGLQERGWSDGRNMRVEYRWGLGGPDRLRKYAAELLALAPDVTLAAGAPALASLSTNW